MFQKKYDETSVDSIVNFAKSLAGKSLDEVVTLPRDVENSRNRGNLGNLVEQFFFELPITTSGIDFPKAKLELKTTGIVRSSSGQYKAKERLVLTMINYLNIVEETWESSVLFTKCQLMLILFYLYQNDAPSFKQKFVLEPFLYKMHENDLQVIRNDWEFIKSKILEGKAHEISEGDTFYLGACRKGSGGPSEVDREQPFSKQKAKSRAFSFKPSYVNTLIAQTTHVDGNLKVPKETKYAVPNPEADEPQALLENQKTDSKFDFIPDFLVQDETPEVTFKFKAGETFESITAQKFGPYLGMSLDEISGIIGYRKSGTNHKGFVRDLAMRILSDGGKSVPELEKAGVELKTVRLKASGMPKESMSFPGFKFLEIVDQEWEESSFFERLENKFLFIVIRDDSNGIERLEKIQYWNMPFVDRLEAQRVWEETRRRVMINAHDLPKQSESNIAHVRPKARNGSDTLLTPQGDYVVKQCFWLNARYIKSVVDEI